MNWTPRRVTNCQCQEVIQFALISLKRILLCSAHHCRGVFSSNKERKANYNLMGEIACPSNVFYTVRLHLCLTINPLGVWIREKIHIWRSSVVQKSWKDKVLQTLNRSNLILFPLHLYLWNNDQKELFTCPLLHQGVTTPSPYYLQLYMPCKQ